MISVVGHTAVDYLMRVPFLPDRNHSASVTERHTAFGGGAANIAAGIARLGEPCSLISAVGPDFAGSAYDRWMTDLGINRRFFIHATLPTPAAFIFTDDAGDQVTYFDWGASRVFAREEAPALPFVHLATADPGFNLRVAEKSIFTSFDPGQDLHRYSAEQLTGLLGTISLLFANHHEIQGMCRTLRMSEEDLIDQVPLSVVTRGAEGSTLHNKGAHIHIPAVPVRMVDPTGAGDAYRAGFLSAYVRGYDAADCCRIGTVVASFVVEHPGCQTHLPGWDGMMDRYMRHFGDFPDAGPRRG